MKKYFIAGTNEELVFGDTIGLNLTKKSKYGQRIVDSSIEFTKLSLPLLLEIGAVEEVEVDEEKADTLVGGLLDFEEESPCEALEALEEDFENLEEKVESLEQEIEQFKDMRKDYVRLTSEMLDTFKEVMFRHLNKEEKKNAQPKKK